MTRKYVQCPKCKRLVLRKDYEDGSFNLFDEYTLWDGKKTLNPHANVCYWREPEAKTLAEVAEARKEKAGW